VESSSETVLGLAFCRELVLLLKGEIGVVNEPGRNPAFWFTAELESVEATGSEVEVRWPDMHAMRVLVVDDAPGMRNILVEQLTSWNCRATAAASGREGLEILRQAAGAGVPYHLALVDWNMPEMNGREFAGIVRQDALLRDVRLILLDSVLGAGGSPASVAGFDACMGKPVRQSDLFNTILDLPRDARLLYPRSADPAMIHAAEIATSQAHILLVHSDPLVREAVSRTIQTAGYRCTQVGTGEEAVREACTGRYGLILIDCELPEPDGFGVTAEIRLWEREQSLERAETRVPIVALSDNKSDLQRRRCFAAGMDDCIVLQGDPDRFSEMVVEWVEGSTREKRSIECPGGQPDKDDRVDAGTGGEASEPAINYEALLAEWDENGEFVAQVLETFLRVTTQDVTELKDACRGGDADRIARLAHRVKGSAGEVGAQALRSRAARLEAIGRASDLTGVDDSMAALQAEFERLSTQIMEGVP